MAGVAIEELKQTALLQVFDDFIRHGTACVWKRSATIRKRDETERLSADGAEDSNTIYTKTFKIIARFRKRRTAFHSKISSMRRVLNMQIARRLQRKRIFSPLSNQNDKSLSSLLEKQYKKLKFPFGKGSSSERQSACYANEKRLEGNRTTKCLWSNYDSHYCHQKFF